MVDSVRCWFYVAANPGCTALAPNGNNVFSLPAQYTYGTSGRNILQADSLKQLDVTLKKAFPVTEHKVFELRGEFFNIANHPTFAAPSTNINSSSGGQVSSTLNAARIVQLAVKFKF